MGSLASTIELAVVVPCFNERDNVALLVEKLETALFAYFFIPGPGVGPASHFQNPPKAG
jgi:hypothetical protein